MMLNVKVRQTLEARKYNLREGYFYICTIMTFEEREDSEVKHLDILF